MSCNGCRILRKGCSENCILRQSLEGTEYSPQAQANATLFVAKFFGRARLMTFLSSVPQPQRPALFQSLLHEACGRTVNPVTGALGFLSTGNWHVCQSAVSSVLNGRMIQPLPSGFSSKDLLSLPKDKDTDIDDMGCKRKASSLSYVGDGGQRTTLCLKAVAREKRRQASPLSDDQSVMTTASESNTLFSNTQRRHEFLLQREEDNYGSGHSRDETKLLQLFV